MPLDWPDDLLAILACPKCKGGLDRLAEPEGFGCRRCGLFYGVTDGIPDFLIEDAVPWDPAAGKAAPRGGRPRPDGTGGR